MQAPKGYSRTRIILNWGIAVLVLAQCIFCEAIIDTWEAITKGLETATDLLVPQHIFGGMLIALFFIWRLVLRSSWGVPPPPDDEPAVLKAAAHITRWVFSVLLLVMSVPGSVASFGGIEQAAGNHSLTKLAILILTVLQLAATLLHQFF